MPVMRKWLRFLIWTVVIIGTLIGLARAVAIRWWRVPTMEQDPDLVSSLSPTLQGGDLVLLWRLTGTEFGDLVVCPEPGSPGRVVVGRIVAMENDRITVEGTGFTVNDKPAASERGCLPGTFQGTSPGTGEPVEQVCTVEAVRGVTHKRGNVPAGFPAPSTDSKEVPPGHVYLLSDNRAFPYDSRNYGTVPKAACRETVIFRLVGKKGYFDAAARLTFIQ
jgi:signal peptidase I